MATAGHVDHGKSALVRALTGMEPDRWEEERRRGMTIGLGFAWTRLPSGADVAIVDVPGHERFVTTMLSGVGPVPAVMLVVAADEGWSAQTEEHLGVIDALGIAHCLLVVTKADLADPRPVTAAAVERIRRTSVGPLADDRQVAVSARTGEGMDDLRGALDRMLGGLPPPVVDAPVRLWVDRSFAVRGAGTVVTGTLGAGRLRVGETVEFASGAAATIRGLQSENRPVTAVEPVRRVAVNLRGVVATGIRRGDALVTPDAWLLLDEVDVVAAAGDLGDWVTGAQPQVHVGAATVPARIRLLDDTAARLRLASRLPLRVGDRLILRDAGRRTTAAVDVADVFPEPLRRRGTAGALAAQLRRQSSADDVVDRRGVMETQLLGRAGYPAEPARAVRAGRWWCSSIRIREWADELRDVVASGSEVPLETLRRRLDLPDQAVFARVLQEVPGLAVRDGRLEPSGETAADSPALADLLRRLAADPLDAPDGAELERLGIPAAELSRCLRQGRLLELTRGVYVAPEAVAHAVAGLERLPQPFTAGQARTALGHSRRVVVPLLEHLDRLRLTRRIDDRSRTLRSG